MSEVPTLDEIRTWGATVDLVQGGRPFGIGRTKAYELAKAGQFPVAVIRIGRTFRVRTADLLALLEGQDPAHSAA